MRTITVLLLTTIVSRTVSSQTTELPLVNPGFETGTIAGWTYDADPALAEFQMIPWLETPNRFAVSLVGTGLLPPATPTVREASLTQEVVMPDAADVRWSFYVSIYPVIRQWMHYPPENGASFRARIAGESGFSFEARVAMRLLNDGSRRYRVSLPWTWTVQQFSLGRDHWTFTTDNLTRWFRPGETVTVTYTNAFQVPGNNHNAPYATVDDQPPNWAGIREIPLRDNVDLDLLPTPARVFRRGDANGDSEVDLSDAVYTLSWRFVGGDAPGCPDAADANDDGSVDLSDAVYTLGWRFLGGPPPPDPGPNDCGADSTDDDLGRWCHQICATSP